MEIAAQPVILHVEDNEIVRYTVSRVLRQAGFTVQEAATGQEALRLAAAQPALILLDVNLPDVNGIDVCRQLKANPATAAIPLLHLSNTYVRSENKVKGLGLRDKTPFGCGKNCEISCNNQCL
jgi:CheY-like chemotaxis protein